MLEEIKNIMRKLVLTAGDSKTGAGGTFTFFFSFFSFWLHFVSLLHAFQRAPAVSLLPEDY